MNWYLLKIIFQIMCGNGNHTPQFDEQLRLILGEDENEALAKAKKIGEGEQDSFFNEKRQLVRWQFIGVSELYNLSNMIDGAEIFSRIEEYAHADAYIKLVHRRAEQLQQTESTKLLQLI
jgi:hypothetical protein